MMQMDSEGDSWDMIPTAQLHRFPPYLKHRWKTKCQLMILLGSVSMHCSETFWKKKPKVYGFLVYYNIPWSDILCRCEL